MELTNETQTRLASFDHNSGGNQFFEHTTYTNGALTLAFIREPGSHSSGAIDWSAARSYVRLTVEEDDMSRTLVALDDAQALEIFIAGQWAEIYCTADDERLNAKEGRNCYPTVNRAANRLGSGLWRQTADVRLRTA